jgi:hypothetical protein
VVFILAKEKSNKKKKGCLGCLGLLILIIIIGSCAAILGGDEEDQAPPAPQEEQNQTDDMAAEKEEQVEENKKDVKEKEDQPKEEQPVKEDKAPEDLSGFVEYAVKKEAGETTNHDDEELKSRVYKVSVDGDVVWVQAVADDNFTKNTIRKSIQRDSTDILEEIYTNRDDVSEVTLEWVFPLQDAYGNAKIGPIVTIILSKSTSDKINWENFTSSNLPKVADTYIEYPAIKD